MLTWEAKGWNGSWRHGVFSGFTFSESEKSALEQLEGGPCSVIAPVQAFILKFLLLEYGNLRFRDAVSVIHVLHVYL